MILLYLLAENFAKNVIFVMVKSSIFVLSKLTTFDNYLNISLNIISDVTMLRGNSMERVKHALYI